MVCANGGRDQPWFVPAADATGDGDATAALMKAGEDAATAAWGAPPAGHATGDGDATAA